MPRPRPWSPCRSFAGALFGLLAFALFAPGRADAGCLHYSVISGARFDTLELSELHGIDARGDDTTAAPRPDPPAPCTGAFCTGSPATPVLPAPPVPPSADDVYLALTEPPAPSPERAELLPPDGRLCPVRGGSGVFHPPRPSCPLPLV